MVKPENIRIVEEKVRSAARAFCGRSFPDLWIYFGNEDDWWDWPDLLGVPVVNLGRFSDIHQSTFSDVDCPFRPCWFGEELGWQKEVIKKFQCRYAETGDF